MKTVFKDAAIFDVCYLAIFWAFIGTFSDGGQTSGMFVIISFLLVLVLTFYYLIAGLVIKAAKVKMTFFMKAILLFLLAELAVLTVIGTIPLFGFLQEFGQGSESFSKAPYEDSTALFRKERDFALSITGLLSAICFFVIRTLTHRNSKA